MKTSKNITDKDTNVVPKNERFLGQNFKMRYLVNTKILQV